MGRELRSLRHLVDLIEMEFASVAAEFAATDEHELDGANSSVEWIRHECRMSIAAASHALAVGEQAHGLPQSITALTEGRLGYGHVALLASTAAHVRHATGLFEEAPLLAQALEHSVSRFRFDCAHARHAADASAYLEA